jgi:glyoxylase-like metal-dependent hydrolase (beta-lactamase superfamily II)
MSDLSAFAENVWIVEGPSVRDMGVMFTTRMTIVRLCNGSLWVDSPVSVLSETLKRIAELGPVRYLVTGTPRHVWRLTAWHTLLSEAEVWAPRPTAFTLRNGDLPFTGILGDLAPEGWADDIDQLAFKGNPLIEEVVFFHKQSRTVIVDDLIQVHPILKDRPFRNALIRLGGVAYPHGGVPLDIRLTFIRRNLARQSLQKLLSWDFDRMIIAHGPCIEKDAKAFVERAFRWLAR